MYFSKGSVFPLCYSWVPGPGLAMVIFLGSGTPFLQSLSQTIKVYRDFHNKPHQYKPFLRSAQRNARGQ